MNPLDNTPPGNRKQFFGQKISRLGININNAGDNELLYKNDYDSSLETYYSDLGNPVVEIGKLPNGGYGIRVPDSNGIGIAQFGEFPDGSAALKVAKPGIEVATANDSQLIFNSSQDIFKVVDKISTNIPAFITTYNGSNTGGSSFLTIPHGQSFIPIIQVYAQAQLFNSSFVAVAVSYVPCPIYVSASALFNAYWFPAVSGSSYPCNILFGVDETNIYLSMNYSASGNHADTISAVPITIFILQETAATS